MESREPTIPRPSDTISEIASILAEGYVRLRRSRRLPHNDQDRAIYVSQSEEFEAVSENRLDCSSQRSLHAENG